jgi:hypothetical protein
MGAMRVQLTLPAPWPPDSAFVIEELRPITWLVGPNGTGKTRFLSAIRSSLNVETQLLSADRLTGVRIEKGAAGVWGNYLDRGLDRSHLSRFVQSFYQDGGLLGALALLCDRPDLRIRVEASLSELLKRHISLDMIDGLLFPSAQWGEATPLGLIRFFGHPKKGGYDGHDGEGAKAAA